MTKQTNKWTNECVNVQIDTGIQNMYEDALKNDLISLSTSKSTSTSKRRIFNWVNNIWNIMNMKSAFRAIITHIHGE